MSAVPRLAGMKAVLSWFLVLAAGCLDGTDGATPDAGNVAGPPGWTCDVKAFDDGQVCHCACGAPDPDCEDPQLRVANCKLGDVCPAGTCTACGNGHLEVPEACDPELPAVEQCGPLGYQPGDVPCSSRCTWAFDTCTPLATCGNGQLDPAEHCDGAAIQAGRSCGALGFTAGDLACTAACTIDASACHSCGNSTLEGPEACDDGNVGPGDGCSASCTVEPGWYCNGISCAPVCGDGVRIGGEACDDGDTTGGDGCTSQCTIESNCECSGQPSLCSCYKVETIDSQSNYVGIDTASLALDATTGMLHVAYAYGIDFNDAQGFNKEHAHAAYAARSGTTWTKSVVHVWDQNRAGIDPQRFRLAFDGGAPRLAFQRPFDPNGTFASASFDGSAWQIDFGNFYYAYDFVRGGGAWHALVEEANAQKYVAGAPNAWTRNEAITVTPDKRRIGYGSNGDVYISKAVQANLSPPSFALELRRRDVSTGTWSLAYSHTTQAPAGSGVNSVESWPVALPNGGMAILDDGFNCQGQRWLRAHRMPGASGPETIADLSGFPVSCTGGGTSYRLARKITAVDPQGRLHVMIQIPPNSSSASTTGVIDYYRDGSTWKSRSLPLPGATPMAMEIDQSGTTHLLVTQPGSTSGTMRLVYVQVGPSSWP